MSLVHHQDLFPASADGKVSAKELMEQGANMGVVYWEKEYQDIIILPSISVDPIELKKIVGFAHYEERQLYNLFLLRNPDTRVIFISSLPIDPTVIEYYVMVLGQEKIDLRGRLFMMSTYDSSPVPLTLKVLNRPRLVRRIKQSIRHPHKACITCFVSTPMEDKLAKSLGVPLLAANHKHWWYGTKAGGKEIFAAAGVNYPKATKLYTTPEDLAKGIVELHKQNQDCHAMVIKLNESFAGEGNAVLYLEPIVKKLDVFATSGFMMDEADEEVTRDDRMYESILNEFPRMHFQGRDVTWERFREQMDMLGVLAELFVEGEGISAPSSPSLQACIDFNGSVHILSTHEQLLGGPDGHQFLGCKFPCNAEYRELVQSEGMKIAESLAAKGVHDHFGVDFMTFEKANGEYDITAIEINLRHGGTTHPAMVLKLLTGGYYDTQSCLFYTAEGEPRYYVASDNLTKEQYVGLLPYDVRKLFSVHPVHYNHDTKIGVVFHLLGSLSQYGKVGLTCIGRSPEEAEEIYQTSVSILDEATKNVLEERHDVEIHCFKNDRK